MTFQEYKSFVHIESTGNIALIIEAGKGATIVIPIQGNTATIIYTNQLDDTFQFTTIAEAITTGIEMVRAS